MLEKSMYDSWASRIHLFIKGNKNGRMMLDSIDEGPLVYPTVVGEDSKFVTDVKLAESLYTTNYDQLYAYLSQQEQHANEQREDLIDCINKAIAFLSVVASRFPPSNTQLRTGIATTSRGNYAAGQAKVVKCYNCLGERHMAKQYTQPKRVISSAWFKEKLMLVKAQEAGQILDEEQLAFIADPGIVEVQVAQQTIPQNSAF
ncbi:hypothetical protein Tco_0270205 [Tanacetum coccineum]